MDRDEALALLKRRANYLASSAHIENVGIDTDKLYSRLVAGYEKRVLDKEIANMTTEDRLEAIESLSEWETHYPKHLDEMNGNVILATEMMMSYCEAKKFSSGLKSDALLDLIHWARQNKFGS